MRWCYRVSERSARRRSASHLAAQRCATPWLVGESDPHKPVPPDELYEKLKPFKERVAEDIRDS